MTYPPGTKNSSDSHAVLCEEVAALRAENEKLREICNRDAKFANETGERNSELLLENQQLYESYDKHHQECIYERDRLRAALMVAAAVAYVWPETRP